jgi:hypothetical protein
LNPYVERVIGSIRRECLDHIVVFNERHLDRFLSSYIDYYHEAAFRLICFLFNLLADFKREITRDESLRLMTPRTQLLVAGAVLSADGRKKVLRLGLRGPWRERFCPLLQRISELGTSTVAQFASHTKNPTPRPWKPRRPYHRSASTEVFGFSQTDRCCYSV